MDSSMFPNPNRGNKFRGGSPWRGGGQRWRGMNASGSGDQMFSSPYQDVRSNPYGWSEPRHPFPRGGGGGGYRQQSDRWQNRRSCGTPRGHPGTSYNNRTFAPRTQSDEVDIRAYVIPAMTDNPWKHLEKQLNTDSSSAVNSTDTSN
ncbi:hypothetical protein Q1695_014539 [Nippostrongylus brasiliensis]|nr:hypothetical protein Q1695_014539 [Nippostrongylus brasiliensis]